MDDIMLTERILLLPKTFYMTGNKSFFDLLKDSGYFEDYNDVTEVNIREQLKTHPEYCEQWIEWSENQRSDSGWYILQQDSNNHIYIVGCFHSRDQITSKEFTDSIQAVAYFIKNQIEYLRKLGDVSD